MRAAAASPDGFVWLGVRNRRRTSSTPSRASSTLHELAVEDARRGASAAEGRAVRRHAAGRGQDGASRDEGERAGRVGELLSSSTRASSSPCATAPARSTPSASGSSAGRTCSRSGRPGSCYAILDRVVDDYEVVAEAVDAAISRRSRRRCSRRNAGTRRSGSTARARGARVPPRGRAAAARRRPARARALRARARAAAHYFRDVVDHSARVGARISGFRELLTSALQANLTQVAVRQNEDMRKISAWVAILAVPDEVAGDLRHELRPHARSCVGVRLPGGPRRDRARVPAAVPPLQARGLALIGLHDFLIPAAVIGIGA